jgi:C_GCAxxG_C_C family probable redox protein
MENLDSRLRDLFDSGYCCAESVLIAFAEYKGIESDLIPKITTGLCAGFSRKSGVCGALTSAILALNMVRGRTSPNESMDGNYGVVQQLIESFKDRFGSVNCTELLGCDLATEEGRAIFSDKNLVENCKEYSVIAAKMAIGLLDNTSDV